MDGRLFHQWRRARRISAECSWLALIGFALAVAYVPWITGAASTPRWIVLVAGAVCLSLHAGRIPNRSLSVADIAAIWFVVWVLVSLFWSPALEAWDEAWKILLLAVLFIVGGRLSNLRPLYAGCAVGVGLSSALVALDRIGLISYAQTGPPSGLFVNGLYLAEFAAMVIVACHASGMHRLALLCWPSLLLVQLARGPLLACAVAGIMAVAPRYRGRALLLVVGAIGAVGLGIAFRPESVIDRLQTWADLLRGASLWGAGLGSYARDSALLSSVDLAVRKTHANNDFLEIAYELGLPGIVCAVVFVGALLWPRSSMVEHQPLTLRVVGSSPAAAAKLVLIVFLVEAMFGFPLHMAATAGMFALVAGHLSRRA